MQIGAQIIKYKHRIAVKLEKIQRENNHSRPFSIELMFLLSFTPWCGFYGLPVSISNDPFLYNSDDPLLFCLGILNIYLYLAKLSSVEGSQERSK